MFTLLLQVFATRTVHVYAFNLSSYSSSDLLGKIRTVPMYTGETSILSVRSTGAALLRLKLTALLSYGPRETLELTIFINDNFS